MVRLLVMLLLVVIWVCSLIRGIPIISHLDSSFFYTFGTTLVFALLGFPVTASNWCQALFPIVSGNYWYMTTYFGFLTVMPIIDGGLRAMSNHQLKHLVILMLLVFSLVPALT